MANSERKLITKIAQTIFDKKGFNILALDVRGICTMTDYFIIAEGNVDRHVKAICGAIVDSLLEEGLNPLHIDGEQISDWIVLDYGYFVVHLFIPELRHKYALEELWKKGRIIDVPLILQKDTGNNPNL